MFPKRATCFVAVGAVAFGLGYVYLPRSDRGWESLYDRVQGQFIVRDPSPAGSLSQKVLHDLHSGFYGSDSNVCEL